MTTAPATHHQLCTNCGFVGVPTRIVPGSNVTGCLLLVLFVIPGLIYAVWQHMKAGMGCPNCKTVGTMIPATSPRAQEIMRNRPA